MRFLAARTKPSLDALEAKRRVLNLYREWIRQAPIIVTVHALDVTVEKFRARVRVEFEKNRPVEHLPIIDGLIFKGTQNLIEAVSLFQQENHLMDAFDKQSREDVRALQEASFSLSNTFSRKDVSTGSNLVQNIAEKDSLEIVSRPGSTFLFNFLRKNAAQ